MSKEAEMIAEQAEGLKLPVEEVVDVAESATVESVSDEEQIALSNGWKKDGEFSAGEFNRRGELFGKIHDQKKEMAELKASINELIKHNREIEERTRQRTLQEMETKKLEAVESGDVDTFKVYDEELKKAYNTGAPQAKPNVTPEANNFMERNKDWFANDTIEHYEMQQYAYAVDQFIHSQNPNIPHEDALKKIELEVHQRFPKYFENKNKKAPPVVGGATKGVSSSKSEGTTISLNELSEIQQHLYTQACRGEIPGMTGKEYLKQLKQVHETGKL